MDTSMRCLISAVPFILTLSFALLLGPQYAQAQYQETGRERRKAPTRGMGPGSVDSSFSSYYSTGATVGSEMQLKVNNRLQLAQKGREGAPQSDCWSAAVEAMDSSCDVALQNRGYKSRLALHFLHCQLEFDHRHDKHAVAECLEKNPIGNPSSTPKLEAAVTECISKLERSLYIQYSDETMYVDSLCQFFQNTNFRRNMDQMVQNMALAGQDTTQTLVDILKKTHDVGAGILKISASQEQELDHLAKVLGFLLQHTQLAEKHQATLIQGEDKLNSLGDAMSLLHSLQLNFSTAQRRMADHVSLELEAHRSKLGMLGAHLASVNTGVEQANSLSLQLQDSQASQVKELLETVSAMQLLGVKQQEAAAKAHQLLAEVEGVRGSVGNLRDSFKDLEGATGIIERVVTLLTEKQDTFFTTLDKVLEMLRRLESITGDVSGAIHVLFAMMLYSTLFFMTFLASLHKRLAHGKGGLLLTVAVTFGLEVFLWLQGSKAIRLLVAASLEAGSNASLTPLPFLAWVGSFWPGGSAVSSSGVALDTFDALDVALNQLKQGQWILRYCGLLVLVAQGYRTARRYKTSEERMMMVVRKAIRLENGQQQPTTCTSSALARSPSKASRASRLTTSTEQDETSSQVSTTLSEFEGEDGESMAPTSVATRKGRSTQITNSSSKRVSSSRKSAKKS